MTSKPRLLLVVPSATSFLTFLSEVAVAWRDRGGAVAVATADELPGDVAGRWPEGVERLSLPSLRGTSIRQLASTVMALTRHIRAWNPDIVHAHFVAAGLALALSRRRPGLLRVATFHGLHGSMSGGKRSLAAAIAEPFIARRMDHVWVLNEEDEAFLRDRGLGSRVSRLACLGLGCNLRQFDSSRFTDSERARLRASLGIPSGAEVLTFLGRRTAFKGFHTVLRAFRIVQAARPNVRLLLVGTADAMHPDGLEPAERQMLADDPAIIDVGWCGDPAPLLAITTLLLFPSTREGMPVNVMEALSMGVPVIASQTRGSRDIVMDNETGILVEHAVPEEFASVVKRLLANPQKLETMAIDAVRSRRRLDRNRFVDAQCRAYDILSSTA